MPAYLFSWQQAKMYEENHQLLKITNHYMMWENAVIINIKIEKQKKSFAISVRVVTVLKLSTFGNNTSISSNICMCNLKFESLKVI